MANDPHTSKSVGAAVRIAQEDSSDVLLDMLLQRYRKAAEELYMAVKLRDAELLSMLESHDRNTVIKAGFELQRRKLERMTREEVRAYMLERGLAK